MGHSCYSKPMQVSDEKSVFIQKHVISTHRDSKFIAEFHMIMFDKSSRNAFYKYLEKNYSTNNIQYFEGVERLKEQLKVEDMIENEFRLLVIPLLQMSTFVDLHVNDTLKSEMKRILYDKLQSKVLLTRFDREMIVKNLEDAQEDIITSMGNIIQKFERSKEFNDYIQYQSKNSDRMPIPQNTKHRSGSHENSISRSLRGFKNEEILIVENSSLISKILICSLQQTFRKVLHAINEKEAMDALSDRVFDIVLFSLDVGDEAGLRIYALYKERCDEVGMQADKFIGMTSDPQSPAITTHVQQGYRKILVRPFDHHDFMSAIKRTTRM